MRSIFATAIIAFANAGKVHEYFAESNLICGICQDAVKTAANGTFEELDALYTVFPGLQTRVNQKYGQKELVNL